MPSITSLMTGLSGLLSNSRRLDVIGNNIANVNTTAFKANRLHFAPMYGLAQSMATAVAGNGAGPIPSSIGMGSALTGTSRSFLQGTIASTGIATDMAIDGDGFFMVQNGLGIQYTRDGSFLLDSGGNLVTRSGFNVQGWVSGPNGTVIQGATQSINIPLGTLSIASATTNVGIGGVLNSAGPIATHGSKHLSQVFYLDQALTQVATGTEDLTTTPLYVDDGTGNGILAFDSAGPPTSITISGVTKGGTPLPAKTFALSATAVPGTDGFGLTLNDFASFMGQALGLDSTVVNGQDLGGGVTFANGQLVVNGNEGTVQDLNIVQADVTVNGAGAGLTNPFDFTKSQSADGESVRTTIAVFDSLGNPTNLDVTFVLEDRDAQGATTWQMLVEDDDSAAFPRVIQVGSVSFDSNGNLVSSQNTGVVVPQGVPPNNGPGQPITLDLANALGSLQALANGASVISTVANDGAAPGTLSQFVVDQNGEIVGGFTNGLTRVLGQVVLARFNNNNGLQDMGNNQFGETPLSGPAMVGVPQTLGMGNLVDGSLEQSNVDLSSEFVDMVQATTGFSASSRVITTADAMLQNLLAMGR